MKQPVKRFGGHRGQIISIWFESQLNALLALYWRSVLLRLNANSWQRRFLWMKVYWGVTSPYLTDLQVKEKRHRKTTKFSLNEFWWQSSKWIITNMVRKWISSMILINYSPKLNFIFWRKIYPPCTGPFQIIFGLLNRQERSYTVLLLWLSCLKTD